jgi:hypothetical protein
MTATYSFNSVRSPTFGSPSLSFFITFSSLASSSFVMNKRESFSEFHQMTTGVFSWHPEIIGKKEIFLKNHLVITISRSYIKY